jgi:hypothetical protein
VKNLLSLIESSSTLLFGCNTSQNNIDYASSDELTTLFNLRGAIQASLLQLHVETFCANELFPLIDKTDNER